MAEQTNFYAVQRGAPWSFRPVSDGVINWYLYNFGSNLGVAFVERPSNLWVEMPWNCIFRVKNIVFSSASGGLRPPDPPRWAPYIFTSGFFFFPCAHPCMNNCLVNPIKSHWMCKQPFREIMNILRVPLLVSMQMSMNQILPHYINFKNG